MSSALLRGLYGRPIQAEDPFLDAVAQYEAPNPVLYGAQDGALGRGFRSGLRNTRATSQAFVASALEAAGKDPAAADWYTAAQRDADLAAQLAPDITDYRQVTDVGSGLRYAAGAVGQGVATTLPAMAGVALTRGRVAPFLTGSAAMLPQEAGESVLTLRNDPEAMKLSAAERFAITTGKGTAGAVAETLVPFALQKRLGLRLPASAPRAAGELLGAAGVEGVTEGVQTKMGQFAHGIANPNRDTSGDTHEIINAALTGAAGGAGIAAPHIGVATGLDALNSVGAFAKRGADRALDAGQALGKKGIEAGGSILDEVKARAGEAIDLAQTGTLLSEADTLPPEVAAQGQDAAIEHLVQQDEQKKQFVTDRLTYLANTGSQQAQEMLDTLSDPETYSRAKTFLSDTYKATVSNKKLSDFADSVKGFLAPSADKKSNEQLTSFQRLALDEMLAATPPDIAQSEGFQSAAPLMINALAKLRDDFHPAIRRQAAAEFAQLYGDQAFELAAKIGALAARDNPNLDAGFVESDLRKQLSDGLARQKSGLEVVKKNLTTDGIVALQDALGTKLDDSHLSTLNDTLVRRAASGKSSADAQLQQIFGANLSRVENFYRALHENDSQSESRAVQKDESDSTDGEVETSDEQDFVERQAAKAAGDPVFVGKKDSPTLFDKAFPKAIEERIAKERLKDATLEYAAVPAEQAIKEAGLDPAKFGDLSGKSVIRGYAVTDNNEATVLTARDVAELSSESDVVRDAGGKQNADDTAFTDKAGVKKLRRKARASDGVIHFETNDGASVSVPAYKLAYTMQGRLRKSATGETSQIDALHAGVSSLLGGEMKRAYVLNTKGEEVDLSTPGAYESVRLGKETVAVKVEAQTKQKKKEHAAYWRSKLKPAREALEGENGAALEAAIERDLTAALERATKAKDRAAYKLARNELKKWHTSPALYLAKEWQKLGEWERSADRKGSTDTDPFAETDAGAVEVKLQQEQLDAEASQAEIETRRQAKSIPKEASKDAKDRLAAMQKAVAANEQALGPIATDEQVAEAKAYVEKTLGNEIKLVFEQSLGGISGEWEKGAADNTIRIALNAGPGVLSTAHHEAMHEFFARLTKLGKDNVKSVLLNAANSPTVSRQLERLLRNEPAALKQIKADPEERLAYMYQFWSAEQLTIGPKTAGVFAKIKAFFRKITGLISTDERAEAILAAFHEGQTAEIGATGRVLDEILGRGDKARATITKLKPVYQKAYAFAMPAADVLEDSENPHAIEIGNRFFTPLVGESSDKWGLLNANRALNATWTNRFGDSIHGLTNDEMKLLRETLSTGKASNFAPVDAAAKEIKQTLKDFREYMVSRGVVIGNRKDYFPRVWDFEKVAGDIEGFNKMLTTHYPEKFPTAEAAEALTHRMSLLGGVEQEGKPAEDEDSAGFTPFMQAVNKMKLDFIQDEHAQAFLNDDLVEIMTSYLKQGVHRAEYESRFGKGGVELEALITKAVEWETARELENSELGAEFKKLSAAHGESEAINELRTSATLGAQFLEIENAAKVRAQTLVTAVHAMEGTIGHDKVSPAWRKFSSWMIVYQNFRLLPLQLFSSMIDPLGFVVRGGKAGDAFDAMKSGFQEVLNTWTGKEMTRDDKTQLAELLGTIEHQTFLSSLGNTHESMYMTRGARKISGALFKYNGMEGWNRAMRVSATTVAVSFIKEHAAGAGDHSVRWIKELGLKAADVKLDANGEVVLFKEGFEALGMSGEESAIAANKMQRAVNQWVDGAMLRPNAALRPAWSSDPRWGLVFYLKQFTYAFQKTFLARVRNEYMHGNLTPALAMMPFIPTMIAADVLRGLIQGGGDLPAYMKGWGPGDYLMHGVQRASLLGIGQLPIDQLNHPTDIVGPIAQQAVDIFTQPVDESLREATPGVSLIKT